MKQIIYQIKNLCTILLVGVVSLSFSDKSVVAAQDNSQQFIFPGFTMAKIKMKNGTSQDILMNYNSISEKMVYSKDGDLYDLLNTELIDTIYLMSSKFVPVGKIFHEVLLTAPVSLYVQHKGNLLPPGTPAGYGGNSQVSNTKYVSSVGLSTGYYNIDLPEGYIVKVEPVYWLKIGDRYESYVTERQFMKIFPEKESELKQFIKQRRIKFDKLSNMIQLAEFLNTLN
jgi:hypothetical protein